MNLEGPEEDRRKKKDRNQVLGRLQQGKVNRDGRL